MAHLCPKIFDLLFIYLDYLLIILILKFAFSFFFFKIYLGINYKFYCLNFTLIYNFFKNIYS